MRRKEDEQAVHKVNGSLRAHISAPLLSEDFSVLIG